MTKAEASAKIAELEARIAALEMVMIQARSTWGQLPAMAPGCRSDAVFSMILKGGQ